MNKNFTDWNLLKQRLDNKQGLPTFKEREIWWCSLGVNIGHEENGKNEFFSRPILVVRKFNSNIFLGIPLTTKIKENRYYHQISFKETKQCAMLSQIRVWESRRLMDKMGKISWDEFDEIRKKLSDIILGVIQPPHH